MFGTELILFVKRRCKKNELNNTTTTKIFIPD